MARGQGKPDSASLALKFGVASSMPVVAQYLSLREREVVLLRVRAVFCGQFQRAQSGFLRVEPLGLTATTGHQGVFVVVRFGEIGE